ncbi:MAG: DnaJ domain-containing protein [Nitrospirales bacterium]|nr:J domain-containing protein [Nitrospira sp.]MDR4502584.1 DnaJ domain-containing protein [Nitrospirales bacterium]
MARLDYYAVLKVVPDASDEEIKKSYRKLARLYHPDHNQGRQDAETKIRELNAAYEILNNKESRKAYDRLRFGGYREQVDGFGPATEDAPDPNIAFQAMEHTLREEGKKDVFATLIKDQAKIQEELAIIRERVVAKQGYDTFHDTFVRERAAEVITLLVSDELLVRRERLVDVGHQMLISQGICHDQKDQDVKALRTLLEKYYDEGWIQGYVQACELFYVRR